MFKPVPGFQFTGPTTTEQKAFEGITSRLGDTANMFNIEEAAEDWAVEFGETDVQELNGHTWSSFIRLYSRI